MIHTKKKIYDTAIWDVNGKVHNSRRDKGDEFALISEKKLSGRPLGLPKALRNSDTNRKSEWLEKIFMFLYFYSFFNRNSNKAHAEFQLRRTKIDLFYVWLYQVWWFSQKIGVKTFFSTESQLLFVGWLTQHRHWTQTKIDVQLEAQARTKNFHFRAMVLENFYASRSRLSSFFSHLCDTLAPKMNAGMKTKRKISCPINLVRRSAVQFPLSTPYDVSNIMNCCWKSRFSSLAYAHIERAHLWEFSIASHDFVLRLEKLCKLIT